MAQPASKTAQKTASKTASKTARAPRCGGARLPLGNHPGNTGGKKGRSGRRPEAFSRLLARLRQSPELARSLEQAISDPDCRAFPSALKVLTDYDEEKPVEKKQIQGEITVRVVRDPT